MEQDQLEAGGACEKNDRNFSKASLWPTVPAFGPITPSFDTNRSEVVMSWRTASWSMLRQRVRAYKKDASFGLVDCS